MNHHNHNEERKDRFYQGVLYGIILGLGLVWFLGTKEGKEIKKELLSRGQSFLEKSRSSFANEDEDEQLPPIET
jgi:hypothetical protein